MDPTGAILDWGECLPDCPSEEAEIVCQDEPRFPAFVTDTKSILRNATTDYEPGSGLTVMEYGHVSFSCDEGFVFEGSTNITHYAICHNWEFVYNFDLNAKCERERVHGTTWVTTESIS